MTSEKQEKKCEKDIVRNDIHYWNDIGVVLYPSGLYQVFKCLQCEKVKLVELEILK